jgi:hypothetical protein
MLLRNLDVSEGLCNGTRLVVTELCNNIIKAKIITGEYSGREVHIPRITIDSSKSQLGCTMQRHQFPVRAAFAMTIHKAQGQTFEVVGIYLLISVYARHVVCSIFQSQKAKWLKSSFTIRKFSPYKNLVRDREGARERECEREGDGDSVRVRE